MGLCVRSYLLKLSFQFLGDAALPRKQRIAFTQHMELYPTVSLLKSSVVLHHTSLFPHLTDGTLAWSPARALPLQVRSPVNVRGGQTSLLLMCFGIAPFIIDAVGKRWPIVHFLLCRVLISII